MGKVTSVTSEDLQMILLSPEKNCDHSNTLDKQGKQETDDVQHRGPIKETYDWVTRDKADDKRAQATSSQAWALSENTE